MAHSKNLIPENRFEIIMYNTIRKQNVKYKSSNLKYLKTTRP